MKLLPLALCLLCAPAWGQCTMADQSVCIGGGDPSLHQPPHNRIPRCTTPEQSDCWVEDTEPRTLQSPGLTYQAPPSINAPSAWDVCDASGCPTYNAVSCQSLNEGPWHCYPNTKFDLPTTEPERDEMLSPSEHYYLALFGLVGESWHDWSGLERDAFWRWDQRRVPPGAYWEEHSEQWMTSYPPDSPIWLKRLTIAGWNMLCVSHDEGKLSCQRVPRIEGPERKAMVKCDWTPPYVFYGAVVIDGRTFDWCHQEEDHPYKWNDWSGKLTRDADAYSHILGYRENLPVYGPGHDGWVADHLPYATHFYP